MRGERREQKRREEVGGEDEMQMEVLYASWLRCMLERVSESERKQAVSSAARRMFLELGCFWQRRHILLVERVSQEQSAPGGTYVACTGPVL